MHTAVPPVNHPRCRLAGVMLLVVIAAATVAVLLDSEPAGAPPPPCQPWPDCNRNPPPPARPVDPDPSQECSAQTCQNVGEGPGSFDDNGATDPNSGCGMECEYFVFEPDTAAVIGVQVVQVVAPVQVVQVVAPVQVVQVVAPVQVGVVPPVQVGVVAPVQVVQVVAPVQVVQVVAPVQVVQVVQAVQVVQVVQAVQVVQVVQNVPVQVVQNVPVQAVVNAPPVAPAAPSTLPAPTPLLACNSTEFTGSFTGWFANPPSGWGRAAEYEVEWRHGSDPWESESVAYSGNQVLFDGDDNPGDSVDVRIRGRGRQRRYRLGQWSAWSAWGQWSNWAEFSTPTCPPPPLPAPTVTACRSTVGIEASWTIPPRSEVGAGWVIDVHELDIYGSLNRNLTAYSNDSSSLVPWADRSKTFSVPAGQGIRITVLGYGGRTHGPEGYDEAAAQPEPGCGAPQIPATPATPGILPDPGPTLICANTANFEGSFSGWAFSPPTNWEREHEYEAEYLDTSSVWRSMSVTVNTTGELIFDGPADPGNAVDVRVRGRGRHREQVGGVWSPWSGWGSWSGWHSHSTPTCPLPPPPTPNPLPDISGATLLCANNTNFEVRYAGWAWSPPTNWEREHEYEAEYLHSGGSWQTATVARLQNAQVLITGPADPGNTIDVRLRGRGRQRQRVNGTWSAWTPWGTWSGWHPHTTPPCPSLTPQNAPERPSVTCTGNSNVPSDATITWASVGTDTALVEHQYEVSWYFNLQDVNASVRQTVIVGPHATLSTTITVDTDDVAEPSEFDEPFDLTSIRVRASTRIRASSSDPWSSWSNWSDPSGPPDMVPGQVRCVVIVAS